MKREQREGTGVLFVNQKTKDSQPDYTGTMTLDRDYKQGEQIKLSAWKKPTPKNHLIGITINNYKQESYPKPVAMDDNEVPF
jgi:hypothetical protein